MASLFLLAQNYSAAASKAQAYGTVAAVVSVVLVVGSHFILNRWKP